MADILSKQKRSWVMSRIKSTRTGPELKIKRFMKLLGFICQPKGIYGKPDFANKNLRMAVFIDGCFWHKCPNHYKDPKTNNSYWVSKIKRNVRRDKMVSKILRKGGWKVIRIWEHTIEKI